MSIFHNNIRVKSLMGRWSKRQVLGWLAVASSTSIASFWAFWGIIENFHEGWFHESLFLNVGLMFLQYLSPVIIFVSLTLLAIAFPRLGSIAHALVGLLLSLLLFDFNDAVAMLLVIAPMLLLGTLYWYGRPQPRRAAYFLAIGLPALTLVICGLAPVVRIAGRVDDGNLQTRLVEGNGVRLVWAPEGVGWPREGVTWHEALRCCQHLSEDGRTLAESPKNVWRLPTIEEAVRSMSRHGVNSGGIWDGQTKVASYQVRPDKESPLWNVHSQVIYWWTATEIDDEKAYIIVYDGKVWPRRKRFAPAYLAYRCVKPVEAAK
ncbi:MAG TPA: DUF1566 domain-containing protein [Blastocatellia bacterium]|nr:DUF1566 domain-containing protein [Blastocatellia bacterium]